MNTCLGGTLVRREDGTWAWADGTPEPRVEDAALARFAPNFRCVTFADGRCYVEIPEQWRELYHWDESEHVEEAVMGLVKKCGIRAPVFAEGRAEREDNHRAKRKGWMVPVEEWDAVMNQIVGAIWDKKYEGEILAKAKSLGWKG